MIAKLTIRHPEFSSNRLYTGRIRVCFVLFFIFSSTIHAQSPEENYVMSKTYKIQTSTPLSAPSAAQAAVAITYFDGLGRPKQEIAHRMAGDDGDLVTHIEYDLLGRQQKEYLPYGRSASLNFDPSAQANTLAFYAAPPTGQPTDYPYSEVLFENSPLSRIREQAAPGNPWAIHTDNTITFAYETNKDNDIRHYGVSLNGSTPSLKYYGRYAAGQLYKTVTKDENHQQADGKLNTTEEYKNKLGQVVLRRSFVKKTGIGESTKALDTYYVYDLYGNLTFVLPPKLSEQIPATGLPPQNLMDALAYRYQYDHRNRMSAKQVPGKKQETLTYDVLNRLRSTGPALSPFGDETEGRIHIKYDKFDREVYTLWTEGVQTTSSEPETTISEKRISGTQTIRGVTLSYSNDVSPTIGHVLSITYYDDYTYTGAPSNIPTAVGQNQDIDIKYNNTQKPIGLPTGSWTRVIETATQTDAVKDYTLYDGKARAVRQHRTYPDNGITQTDTRFNFIGDPMDVYTTHKKNASADALVIHESFAYNAQSLPVSHTHKINNNPPVTLAQNTYNVLNQIIQKKIGATGFAGTPLQLVDYKYNIRGWLTDINNVNNLNQPGGGPVDLFAFKINYNTVTDAINGQVKELYNGNIAETFWRTATDNIKRKYGYSYDAQNRLTAAYYQLPGTTIPRSDSYSTSYSYDSNGNIETLKRNGEIDDPTYVIPIDDLQYTYDSGNRLKKVADLENHPLGFDPGTAGPNETYVYDDYGNLIADPYKGIEAITYNHLHLPVKVSFQAGETIAYTYLADGSKVKKKTHDGQSNTTTTEYREGFQYRNSLLEFFPYGAGAEGYVKASTGQLNVFYNYVYTYTDHLGNIRLKYTTHPQTGETTILEEDHYYPYGLSHAPYAHHHLTIGLEEPGADITLIEVTPDVSDPHKYKFNGKEYQDEFSIDLYDFGARNYDPAIVRTLTPDPLGEAFYHLSPYSFLNNNPMSNVDPTGAMTLTGQAAKDWFQGLKDDIASKPRKRKEAEDEDDVANPNNPIELEEIVINGKKRKGLQASGINFQDRHAGSMSEWQKMTEGKFSTNHDLADLQWEVSYGDAYKNYFQAQLDAQTAAQHQATNKAAELFLYIMPTPLVGGAVFNRTPMLYRSAKVTSTNFEDILRFGALYGDHLLHQRKTNAINYSYQVYSSQSPNIRRTLYPVQKKLIREKSIFRNVITTQNFEKISGLKKYRGGI